MLVTVEGSDLLALLEGTASAAIRARLVAEYNFAGRRPLPAEPNSNQTTRLMRLFMAGNYIKPVIQVDPGMIRSDRDLLSDGWIEFGVRRGEDVWTITQEVIHWSESAPLCRLTSRGEFYLKNCLVAIRAEQDATRFEQTGVRKIERAKIIMGSPGKVDRMTQTE